MSAALAWADTNLDAAEVRCIIEPGHGASERVAAKLGFGLIGQSDVLPEVVNLYARPRAGQGA